MKNKELLQSLRNKTKEELLKDLKENRDKLRNLRFELSSGKLKDVKVIKKQKKLISQILTVFKEKNLEL